MMHAKKKITQPGFILALLVIFSVQMLVPHIGEASLTRNHDCKKNTSQVLNHNNNPVNIENTSSSANDEPCPHCQNRDHDCSKSCKHSCQTPSGHFAVFGQFNPHSIVAGSLKQFAVSSVPDTLRHKPATKPPQI